MRMALLCSNAFKRQEQTNRTGPRYPMARAGYRQMASIFGASAVRSKTARYFIRRLNLRMPSEAHHGANI